jgi:hypothetical protein
MLCFCQLLLQLQTLSFPQPQLQTVFYFPRFKVFRLPPHLCPQRTHIGCLLHKHLLQVLAHVWDLP